MAHFLDRLFGDPNTKTLKRLRVVVDQINALEPDLEKLTDKELKARSKALRQTVLEKLGYFVEESGGAERRRIKRPPLTKEIQKKEQIVLDEIAPEAGALVREAAKRTLGQRHFDVQLLAGLALHGGNVAEQKTGEGKTLSSTFATYLNALVGRGTHVVTVNDYLAKRDAGWMGQIFNFLGLSVGCIVHETSFLFSEEAFTEENEVGYNLRPCSRQEAYRADITYGTNNEFGFDYLRDNMAPSPLYLRQRPLYFCVIDEVDSILIDEARTPLIISAPAEESGDLYTQFAQLVPRLTAEDYTVDEKERAVSINDSGVKKMQEWLKLENLYEDDNILLVHHLDEAMKAHFLFTRDKDYVVREDEVIIVDEFTGRLMPGRRYSEGLHQAIEAKEGVHIQRESDTLATISFQNFFRLYTKISGMTGTAKTEEEELMKIYGLEVVVVPTHREMVRVDHSDKIFAGEEAKFRAIIEDVKERRANKQPVLLGTISVAKNEHLGKLLEKAGVAHEILNAKNHEKEAGIIANAGAPGAVTLATNMAGRGTDIVLGGAPPEKEDEAEYKKWEERRAQVLAAGGLIVIGSERHESRRIDNQLRGRSGRQGEPGESVFYVSMDDDLMRIFGGEKLKGWMQRANLPEDVPIQNSLVSRSIEQAQKRVEGHNFDLRKHVVQYDDVMNKHREAIYSQRVQVMKALGKDGQNATAKGATGLREMVLGIIKNQAGQLAKRHLTGDPLDWETEPLLAEVGQLAPLSGEDKAGLVEAIKKSTDVAGAGEAISTVLTNLYEKKEAEHGATDQRTLERTVLLKTIDALWVEHLNVMQDLRQGVGLQAVAQHDPLVVYQQKGYEQFRRLTQSVDYESIRQLMHLVKVAAPPVESDGAERSRTPDSELVEEKRPLILQGASEADAGGAAGIEDLVGSPAAPPEEPEPETETEKTMTKGDVNVTVRRVSDRLAAEGARGSDASTPKVGGKKIGRNDPCPCGSGKKYKKCHGR